MLDYLDVKCMKQAAIYLRVSTDQQNYDRQKNELLDYCNRNQLDVKYIFEEKESGRKDDRPEFKRLCELTRDDIQIVVVWEISRLSRKAYMILKVAEDFAQKGISIYALKERLMTLEDDGSWNSTAKLVLGLFASMAQTELETLKDRVMSGKKNKILSGEMDSLIDRFFDILSGKRESKVLTLISAVTPFVTIILYAASYKISCKLYRKGVESYAK